MASLEKKCKDLVILHGCYSNNPQISDWLFTHTICLLRVDCGSAPHLSRVPSGILTVITAKEKGDIANHAYTFTQK